MSSNSLLPRKGHVAVLALEVASAVHFFTHKFLLPTTLEAIAFEENFIESKLVSAMKASAFFSLEK